MKKRKILCIFMIAIIMLTFITPEISAKPTKNKKEKQPRPPRWRWKRPNKPPKNNPQHNKSSPPSEPPTDPPTNSSGPPQNTTGENPGNPQIYPNILHGAYIFIDWQYMVGDWLRQPNERIIILLHEVKSNNSDYNLTVIVFNTANETAFNLTFHPKPSKRCLELYLGALRFSEGNNTVVATVGDLIIHTQTIEKTGFGKIVQTIHFARPGLYRDALHILCARIIK